MKIRGVIFDFDGVLMETDRYHFKAWKAFTDEYGIPFDQKIFDSMRGLSRMASLEVILSNSGQAFSEEEKVRIATVKNELYRSLLKDIGPSEVDPTVRETLALLRSMGLKLAVGSSSKNTPLILEKTELRSCFDAVVDGNCITHAKPDPEVFLKAAGFLGLQPSECIVVEDAEAGIDAGKAGGFITLGMGPAAAYSRTDYPIRSVADIPGVLELAEKRQGC